MHEVQVNLAIMQNVVQNPMVAIDSFSKKVAALPLKGSDCYENRYG